MPSDISGLFFGSGSTGANQPVYGLSGNLTAIDEVTYANTVTVGGSVTYDDCPILCVPSDLVTGLVYLLATPGSKPAIVGNIYKAEE